MNNPSDSILSICAKRTEGGWEAESKRVVGGVCVSVCVVWGGGGRGCEGGAKDKEEQGC